MKEFRQILPILKVNWQVLAEFEILYKILSYSLLNPLFRLLTGAVMKFSGYAYLTKENLFRFLLHPVTLTSMLLIFLLLLGYILIDISAVLYILDQSLHGKKLHLRPVIRFSGRTFRRILFPRNIGLAFMVLMLIPLLGLNILLGYISTMSVPELVTNNISRHLLFYAVCFTVYVLAEILLLPLIFAFHYFALERRSFLASCRRSIRLIKGRKLYTVGVLLITQLMGFLVYFSFVIILVLAGALVHWIFSRQARVSIGFTAAIWGFISIAFRLLIASSIPVAFGSISFLFYKWKRKLAEPVFDRMPIPDKKTTGISRYFPQLKVLLLLLTTGLCCFYIIRICNDRLAIPIEELRITDVTAHRGASAFYPENTMAAFLGAKEQEADWIELDVQQSADGQIFICHDTNLRRTTGINKYSWQVDWEEISSMDAGWKFSPEFTGERIPLLSEAIEFARANDVDLNIELKPTGHETDFEKSVVDLIRGQDFVEHCVITSQHYSVLQNVKKYDPEIHTIYVMGFAYGNITRLEDADGFSVEYSSITPKLVSRVHNAGKEIYAWTVNMKYSINKMIELKVDNIITDNVPLARECIYSNRTSNVLNQYIRWMIR